jgi:hypothetical protein
MMFRIVFWDVLPCKMIILHGSTSQKTVLNKTMNVLASAALGSKPRL